MNEEKLTLSIGHIYPEILNLYGDAGNITTLKKRCEWLGIELKIDEINFKTPITTNDFYYFGSCTSSMFGEISAELLKYKDFLISQRDENKVFLGIQEGYKLFGKTFQDENGQVFDGLSLLNIYTKAGKKRFTGNVTVKTDLIMPNTLVGFENRTDKTFVEGETKPLGQIIMGNAEDKTEGAYYKNVFGTYLHGAFLPKNIHFADYLIKLALKNKYGENVILTELNNELEDKAHEVLVGKSY